MRHIQKAAALSALMLIPTYSQGVASVVEDDNEISSDSIVNNTKEKKLVNVAFRSVDREDLQAGVSVVDMPEIFENNYSTYGLSNMESLVGGFSGGLWGSGSYLVLVDGVPRNMGNVHPAEIAQITFLKGASAVAIYGSKAAKGVIMITTKRGQEGDNRISVRANTGVLVPKSYPKYLGSAEYMTLYNEARANDGLDPSFTDEDIYNHACGSNIYRYPDVDFYSSDYLRKFSSSSDLSAEISGGGERAKFYSYIGLLYQDDLLDFGEGKDNYVNRFNVRGNIDIKLNDWIKSQVNANAVFYNSRGDRSNYWSSSTTLRPNRVAPLIPISYIEQDDENSNTLVANSSYLIDGKYLLGGTQLDQTNPFASMYAAGYSKYTSRQFQFDAGVSMDLEKVLKGLSFNTKFAIDYATSYNTSINNNYAVYGAGWNNYSGVDLITGLTKYGEDSRTGTQTISNSWNEQIISFSGQFDYNRTFNKRHNVSGLLVASGFQYTTSGSYHRNSSANLGVNLSYNYDGKYYADFSGAVVHSAKLPENNRQAFSPTASLSWRLSKEEFLKNSSFIDDLKINVSAGILNTDLDINEYYMYESIYTQTDGSWWGWRDGAQGQTTDSRRGQNYGLGYIQRKEVSLGLEASFLNRLVTVEANLFANRMDGMIIRPSTIYPSYFTTYWPNSSFIPYVNFNEDDRKGVDFNVTFNKKLGQIDWTLGVVGTVIRTRAVKRDENYENDYQNRTGKPLDAIWGLKSDGFFNDEADIENSPKHSFGEVKPGDIKYVDQNGDGIIDSKDEIYLGKYGWNGSPFSMGINLTAKWRSLTFMALCSGNFGNYAMKGGSYFWVQGDGKYSEVVRNRWTEETKATATYPRLTSQSSDNNFRNSDFWLYKTDRFNLSKVQITYDFSHSALGYGLLHGLSVYVSGSNLLTIAREREILELNIGSSPQTRFYNVGVKAVF